MTQETAGAKPFELDPEDFIFYIEDRWLPNIDIGLDNFSHRGYSVPRYLEDEAIRRLRDDEVFEGMPKQPSNASDEAYEDWRAAWSVEARHHRRFEHPPVMASAIEILCLTSDLYAAVDCGKAERAAALGALLICYAIAGGYAIKMESESEALRVLEKVRRKGLLAGAGNKQPDLQKAKAACIRAAAQEWKQDDSLRIGEVADRLREMIRANLGKLPALKPADVPGIDTIKVWLKEANAKGKLKFPPGAQRRGRPPKATSG